MKKQINIKELLYILELEHSCMAFTKWEYHRALKGVEVLKDLVKKQRKVLAKKYHPDSNGGDATRMKEINNAVDLLLTIEVVAIRTPPQLRPIRTGDLFRSYPGKVFYHDSGGTTTSYTWTL